ncbi:CUE domain-containing protein 2-B-like [Crassostrea virginica]|uniref:CUE domain-containing protein 2-B-like n=1 Tax=Crassostrea virginica TaxID=6565 RepID=A0A8B8ALS1_CRAVI|nr:CUE domain-containing protein 2-B-like [Crassostrea virginica]
MATSGKELLVRGKLGDFLQEHGLQNSIGDIDEIVLSYVISILEDLGDDRNAEENIDVDQFVEMMDAYIPGFESIDSVKVCKWMFELSGLITADNQNENQNSGKEEKVCFKGDNSQRFPAADEQSEEINGNESVEEEEPDEEVRMLLEMFPDSCTLEITHCLGLSKGNLETAAQLVLERAEEGTSIKRPKEKTNITPKKGLVLLNDKDLKKKMVERYGYQDTDEDKKTFKPPPLKQEPKKMVRYLDGRIVSTKGERFTEIKKEDAEEMKKTYINLKPAKKYRFH